MPARAQQARTLLALWSGWWLAPLAWSVHLMAAYLLVGWVCQTRQYWPLHLVTLVTLLLALIAAGLSWRLWRHARGPAGGADAAMRGRRRFIALSGVLIALLMALLIVVEGTTTLIIEPCA